MNAKERREIAAIGRRLEDLIRGRMGHCQVTTGGEEFVGLAAGMGTEEWLDFVAAVREIWCASNGRDPEPGCVPPVFFDLFNLHHFDKSVDDVAAWLYEIGARPGDAS